MASTSSTDMVDLFSKFPNLENIPQTNQLCFFNDETFLPNFDLLDEYENDAFGDEEEEALGGEEWEAEENAEVPSSSTKKKRQTNFDLKFEDVKKYFHLKEKLAAQEMNAGLTFLKSKCRELNIDRWPYRKLRSLRSIIRHVKEMGWTNEVQMLEEQYEMMLENPNMELNEHTKKIRQVFFKKNFKRRCDLALRAN